TVILKRIQQPVTPLRPIEQILDYRPLVWTPGDKFHATVTVRRNSISTILNDSMRMYVELKTHRPGKIGLISDLPAKFHRVEVKVLKGEQRKLNRRKRQLARKEDLQLGGHPEMVRWKALDTRGFGTDQNLRLGDVTGDGNKEILFIRPGLTNGSSVVYLCAMNLDGDKLWQHGTPDSPVLDAGVELPVQVHDLDGDGSREVIFVNEGSIHILDGKNGQLLRSVEVPGSIDVQSITFGDLLATGRDNCILLSDRTNHLVVLNERLEMLWKQEVRKGSLPLVYDMNRDGHQEVLMGFSVFDHLGELMFDVGAFIGDQCYGIAVHELQVGLRMIPCLIYAAGDWGLMYFDFSGNLLKQNIMGHVRYVSIAELDAERPGLEAATSNGWGSDGQIHIMDASGQEVLNFMPVSGGGRCLPVNWKGDGEEFFITTADSIRGGMYDVKGQLAVEFPTDGHPVSCYIVQDLTGDARDEILVWNRQELWIYTQDDNPRMGNTYAPDRLPLYNHSMHRMNHSFPGW
ncbi:MAG: hypothetical protein KAT15_28190, partial [Bacteroidales bacterium]|nr:hypothetical protein [Bacteroidales bacterium]